MKECAVEGCRKLAGTRGLCTAHYQRWTYRRKPLDANGKPDLKAILAPTKPKSTASEQAPLAQPEPHPLPTPPKLPALEPKPESTAEFWRLVGAAEELAKQLGKLCHCFISITDESRHLYVSFEEGER